ncbi:MAG TPA: sigma 54-interacting transcriptional regulator [Polyangiaceae bacterium]|nr:sigma 54-interacting transcriptional regulator [Polyangiaceae bacterium]
MTRTGSDQRTTELSRAPDSSAALGIEPAFSLLVVRDGVASTYPLPARGRVLIGRARQAEIRIDHPSVSREHAALHVGESLAIEDLGSANGTRVRRSALSAGAPVAIAADEVIDLGEVLIVVQHRRLEQKLRRASAPVFFELRVEEECARLGASSSSPSASASGEFALARLDVQGALDAAAVQLLLVGSLGPRDLVSSPSPGLFELLLLDTEGDAGEARLERAREVLESRGVRVSTRVACAPRDGASLQALLGRPSLRPVPARVSSAPSDFVVVDEAMRRVCRLLERVADSGLSVLLVGEEGVGKERCAEFVHRCSPRAGHELMRVDCAALSETQLESELFGYERGAFPGAVSDEPGLLESAHGANVFLDDVGDMPLATQVTLARALQTKQVLRLGSRTPRPLDVRVISATDQNLQERITAGLFQVDLYDQLSGIAVLVPPLRERPLDVAPLAQHFLMRAHKLWRPLQTLSPETLLWLQEHDWPGNVRELENLIERAAIACDGEVLEPRHLGLEPLSPAHEQERRSLQR